jgi:hypothetical protein
MLWLKKRPGMVASFLLALLITVPVLSAKAQEDPPTIAGLPASYAIEPVNLPGRVLGDLNLRTTPMVGEDTLIRTLSHNDALWIFERVTDADGDHWYRVQGDAYVHAAEVRLPKAPPEVFSGRWLDVDLTTPAMVTAYEDDRPVASLLAIKGRTTDETPRGTYTILRRVYDETMDSETIGIPRDDPRGYYLDHVLYTQYFTDEGDSLHWNYWSNSFGEEGSHGCLGLSHEDAAWLWDWADVGTLINIHN